MQRTMKDDLQQRQEAAAAVEKRVMSFLAQFDPADRLTLGDAKTIARYAKTTAFEEFSPKEQ